VLSDSPVRPQLTCDSLWFYHLRRKCGRVLTRPFRAFATALPAHSPETGTDRHTVYDTVYDTVYETVYDTVYDTVQEDSNSFMELRAIQVLVIRAAPVIMYQIPVLHNVIRSLLQSAYLFMKRRNIVDVPTDERAEDRPF
jgi:hypothetical protein